MAVYVDQMRPALWKYGKACHLYADGVEELHAFALSIGMRRSWFQDREGFPHYDLTEGRRRRAVARGAVEHTSRELVAFVRKRRKVR
jgi:hypothetical protein